jgi:hypothetical protein
VIGGVTEQGAGSSSICVLNNAHGSFDKCWWHVISDIMFPNSHFGSEKEPQYYGHRNKSDGAVSVGVRYVKSDESGSGSRIPLLGHCTAIVRNKLVWIFDGIIDA